jgi:type VI secretion system secreted protein VgrG
MAEDRVVIESKALGPCRVLALEGREAINALPHFSVDVLTGEAEPDFEAIVGEAASIALGGEDGEPPRQLALIIVGAEYAASHRDGHVLRIELSAPPYLLTLRSGYRIFQNETTQDIVTKILRGSGIQEPNVKWRLLGTYFERVQCSQYGETEWAFIERLLADEGISYWIDFEDDAWALVFGDHQGAAPSIEGAPALRYADPGGAVHAEGALHELVLAHRRTHEAAHVRAFDVDRPDTFIDGKEGSGSRELFEYPTSARNAAAAAIRAKVRLEQLRRFAVRAEGASSCARLQPGRVFAAFGAADDEHNQEYLVVELTHRVVEAAPGTGAEEAYENRFVAIPYGDLFFRPEPPAHVPRVEGVETAVTKGPPGEEIHVDDLGRVKIEYRWDRAGIKDDKSSLWVRSMQLMMGGSMILPRVGWEVAIAFEDGLPDRPVVLGRLYNPAAAVPYGLPGAKATSALKSNTSPGGGSVNEICLSDDAGSQKFAVNASRDLSLQVGGDSIWKIGVNKDHSVDLGHELSVGGAMSANIGGSKKVGADKHVQVEVKGSRINLVGGADILNVGADRKLGISGSYVELIGGVHAIQCNQENTAVMGVFMQGVAGALVHTAGITAGESVTGMRIEMTGGPRMVLTKLAAEEGGKFCTSATVIAGGSVEHSDAKVELSSKSGGTISAGTATLIGGAEIVIECDELHLKAPTIKIEHGASLALGGEHKAEGGKTHVDASKIKKTSGTEAEA